MTVKIDIDMPKTCDECPLSYPKQMLSGRKICLWEQGYRYYRLRHGDKKAPWELQGEINSRGKLATCPLKECK